MEIKQSSSGKRVTIASLIIVLTFAFGNKTNAQEGKNIPLFNMWHLKAYVVDGKTYDPKRKEKNDFILFQEDMTFVSKSEGREEEGTFMLNTNGSYVMMVDTKGEKLKAYIVSMTKETLVLKFDIEEIRDVEVHYKSHI